ncbi:hypothetical protein KSS87_014831 [Heliosperma pusillum]|nr:hypothetical protein KSS87_014831 [Heliosperma pusillum]
MSAMTVAAELNPSNKEVHPARKILGPAGNRPVRVPNQCQKPINKPKPLHKVPDSVIRKNGSVDSSCSSASSSSSSSTARNPLVKKCVSNSRPVASTKHRSRCEWITAYSDRIYISFHDKEWGVPVIDDDSKLFELLCLSMLLADHSWVSILFNRDIFRKLFIGFNPATVAEISEENILSIVISSRSLLSETRVRAVVDNAKRLMEVQKEFGSFSKYCWKFVNNKPQKNGFRHQRQVPVKTPKAELISKDLLRRGFHCVGPIVVYSFLQVAGMVNDHLTTCFRYEQCC